VPSADVRLALAAALQRVVSWSGADAADDAMAVQLGRELERAARAEVVGAVRRLRGAGRSWREVAGFLGLDGESLGVAIADPARLGFDYCAGLPAAPVFALPSFRWECRACGQTVTDRGPDVQGAEGAEAELGHASGCRRIAAPDVADRARGG
jgi:hypothetical protein